MIGATSDPHCGWLARIGEGLPPPEADEIRWSISVSGQPDSHSAGPRLDLAILGDGPHPQMVEQGGLVGLVLRHPWCGHDSSGGSAEALLSRYQAIGVTALSEVRGEATVILWDTRRDTLIVTRAPGGLQPIYFARESGTLWLSDDIPTLLGHGGIRAAPSRRSLSGYLTGIWPTPESTFFDSIQRVPPTQALVWNRGEIDLTTCWEPISDREGIDWVGAEALDQFGAIFEDSVRDSLADERAGIFLSGGLDSVSVAAMARDLNQGRSSARPLALSLVFPDPDCNEEVAQRAIAEQLGLDQIVLGFEDTLDGRSPMRAALDLTAKRPLPLLNIWQPAYLELARRAADRGCRLILTGNGGDEWLTVTPLLAADLWSHLGFRELARLWGTLRRSYRLSSSRMTYNLFWRFGLRLLIADFCKRQLDQRLPRQLERLQTSRMRRNWKPWLSRDPANFEPLADDIQREGRVERLRARQGGYYLREMRTGLSHFLVSHELDEIALLGRETSTLVRQPFMHPDLVSFLIRVRPEILSWEGRSKGLIRETVSRRFPDLGFHSQRKIHSTGYYRRSLLRDLDEIWRYVGGTPVLNQLAVTDPTGVQSLAKEIAEGCRDHQKVHDLWSIVNLETWARAWM